MAQDFKTAFGLADSDTGIATVDADGIALAAIQGLNQQQLKLSEELSDLLGETAAMRKLAAEQKTIIRFLTEQRSSQTAD
jgi:hypothetical protein